MKLKKLFGIIILFGILFGVLYIVKVGGFNLKEKTINTFSNQTTKKKETSTTSIETKKIEDSNDNEELKIIDGILIVNKTYSLPENYVPTNTYKDATDLKYCSLCIYKDAYEKFETMKADLLSLGLNIWIQSGYRSYELQNELYNNYVDRDGKEAADTYSARPGHSEHQTGLAFDLNSISDDFQYTDEGKWVNQNAWKYGFILRYPKGKENITGYKYEPWHLRYVGETLAKELYNNGDWITLEEHFNLTSEYSD